jgi:phenylalanyl-tRNA synthetase alpha chain
MLDQVQQLAAEAKAAIAQAADDRQLEEARVTYLGRKGLLRQLQQGIKDVPAADKPAFGQALNALGNELQEAFTARQEALAAQASPLAAEALDVTLPGRMPRVGRQHPLLATLDRMIDIFLGLGFTVAEGPEVENFYYSFGALNYPEDHPAMDEQMSFYITDNMLLRSQTSTVQIRTMERTQPPVRIVAPGRCFRRDNVDATHCHTFYQIEGLLVDEGVTFADLKGTLDAFAKGMYGDQARMRLRPDFFPYTEPSAEIAMSCILCRGAGCRVCKQSGWLEVGGSGMVDPNVLEEVGYDSERYTGFAFGMGIERLAMLMHGIDDIRLFYSGDMRFLGQF